MGSSYYVLSSDSTHCKARFTLPIYTGHVYTGSVYRALVKKACHDTACTYYKCPRVLPT